MICAKLSVRPIVKVAGRLLLALPWCPSAAQSFAPPSLSVEFLDTLTRLPGNLSVLPASPPIPIDNPQTPAKIELGRRLFFDTRLSRDGSLSCASCHDPDKAFSDARPRAVGIGNKILARRSPTVLNAAYIAAFERTLVTPDSAFDHYAGGEKQALTNQQKRGLILFFAKASCSECHNGPTFTDNKFHGLGRLPGEEQKRDLGRFVVSKNPADRGAFKTPTLRNVSARAPYMHNGSLATLPEVIAWYNRGGGGGKKSDLIHPLNLTADEQVDLLSFLESLSGTMPRVEKPSEAVDEPAP